MHVWKNNTVMLPTINNGGGGLSKGALVGIVLGSISCAGVILACLLLFLQKWREQSNSKKYPVKDKSCELMIDM